MNKETFVKSTRVRISFQEDSAITAAKHGVKGKYFETPLIVGVTDLSTRYPNIAKEWHPYKNGELMPEQISFDSPQYVWWICSRGHSWFSSVRNRTVSKFPSSCVHCQRLEKNLSKKERLIDSHPDLIKEWDFDKNKNIKIDEVVPHSFKRVFWKCEHGHSWQRAIIRRAKYHSKCPYCTGKLPILGENDLKTTHPQLAIEWDYVKNKEDKPEQYSASSSIKVWWKCSECGTSWQKAIRDRTKAVGKDCPCCSDGRVVVEGINDLATTHPEIAKEWNSAVNNDMWQGKYPYINKMPSPKNVSHKSRDLFCWTCSEGHNWFCSPYQRTIQGKLCPDCVPAVKVTPGVNDLKTLFPEIAAEWNYEKNGILKPDMLRAKSGKSVWWRCKHSHEWKATVLNRTHGKGLCPYCNGRKVMPGFNDLATTHPELAKEWDIEKNNLSPTQVMSNWPKVVWWICPHGHSWKSSVTGRLRSKGPNVCPVCSGKKVLTGFNDLATKYPELADEWHPYKNDTPSHKTLVKKYKTAWWWCEKHDHSWEATIGDRINGKKCSECLAEETEYKYDGKTVFDVAPWLIDEWDYEKNKINPKRTYASSGQKVYWRCSKNHSWEAGIHVRTTIKTGCPYCAGKKVSVGENDLGTTHPQVVLMWDFTKNKDIKPTECTAKSSKSVWWKCTEHGSEWKRSIKQQVKSTGCCECADKIKKYEDCWIKRYPNLEKEWDSTKNSIPYEKYSAGSNKKVWWKCSKNHSWEAPIKSRTSGAGCPYCANKKILVGYNDLNTTHAHLMHMWDYAKNKDRSPTECTAGQKNKVWLVCSKKQEGWESRICDWTSGHQYSHCKKHCTRRIEQCC